MPQTFTPKTWADGVSGGTPIVAAELNRIEQGVESMDQRTAALESGQAAVHAVGNSGTALTLDASSASGYVKTITLTANCTFTLTGAIAGFVATLELFLTQDATGGRTVTWPSSVKWAGGAVPTLATTANAVNRVVVVSPNGGTTWYGDLVGTAYA